MPPPLRLLHAIDRATLASGAAVQLVEAAAALARRGHRVTVAARPDGDLEGALREQGIAFGALPFRHEADLGSALRLRPWLREQDVVHVHKGTAHAVALVAATGLGRRPPVVVNRGVSFPLTLLNRWKYRHPRVRAVVCVADAVRRVVIDSAGVPPARIHTIYAGTDPERFHPARVEPARVRRELGVQPGEILVGQVSARPWKGWPDLLAAFARAHRERGVGRLLLVDCHTEETCRQVAARAAQHGVAGAVLTVGFRRDMPDVLAACDIVADASWAGTGITGTVREAMALERPVVATDCGGNRELVVNGESGLLVPVRDPEALAGALARLLGDGELRARLGRSGRRRVLEAFTTARRIDLLEDLYRRVLGPRFSK